MDIVLLPGLDGTGELFVSFVAAIDSRHKTHIVSYPLNEEYSYQALTDFVMKFLPADQDYVLLGESFSGPVAMAVAAQKPRGLKGVILCSSFVRNPMPILSVLSPIVRVAPVKLVPSLLLEFALLGKWSNQRLTDALRRATSKVSTSVLRSRFMCVVSVNVSEHIKSLTVPLLYLRGDSDRLVSEKEGKYVQSVVPDTKLVTLSGPHALLQTRPVESATVVKDFMRNLEILT